MAPASSASIVGTATRVVDAPGFSIDELMGKVATSQDGISVAKVSAKAGTAEPWLTIHYQEWLCVHKGLVQLDLGSTTLAVRAGETVEIASGTRFRPNFVEDTEYTAICTPAFSPTRCIREDESSEGETIAAGLKQLHAGTQGEERSEAAEASEETPEILYHMCPVSDWEAAQKSGVAYYPPTFVQDGHLTHATGVPSRLLSTANHYYQDSSGAWVCLEFTRTALKDLGIFVRDEHATAVGDKATDAALMAKWVCPHIIGGIPLSVVSKTYEMPRDGPAFVGISGLV